MNKRTAFVVSIAWFSLLTIAFISKHHIIRTIEYANKYDFKYKNQSIQALNYDSKTIQPTPNSQSPTRKYKPKTIQPTPNSQSPTRKDKPETIQPTSHSQTPTKKDKPDTIKSTPNPQSSVKKDKPLILVYHVLHGAADWWFITTDKDFAKCPDKCQVTSNRSLYADADMVMFESPRFIKKQVGDQIYLEYFRDWGEWPSVRGNNNQVRVFFAREPPPSVLSGEKLNFAKFLFNYTVTFQPNADIFYPYGHTEKLSESNNDSLPDYGAEKLKPILWIVSNCWPKLRMNYKNELQKYIQVDMFGRCNLTHGDPCKRDYKCVMSMKRQYKFYLAFENCLCTDYITEKFWNALNDGLVPIALGAPKKSYERVAPPNSFIHVDDFTSPQQLADYLHILDKNNTLYNQYHAWRKTHVIQWESANCGLCRLATEKPPKITDITKMWNQATQCKWP